MTDTGAGGVGDERNRVQSAAAECKARPPVDFVYDNGQIMLELLRGRAAEEERRGFVEGLRRLRARARVLEEN